MLKEFKEFLMRGNVVDLAVAVIIGGAFKAIVDSLVADIFNPLIAMIFSVEDIQKVAIKVGSANLLVGNFFGAIINFVLVGFVLFMVVKGLNKASELAKRNKEVVVEEIVEVNPTEEYLKEIRDLLKNK